MMDGDEFTLQPFIIYVYAPIPDDQGDLYFIKITPGVESSVGALLFSFFHLYFTVAN